MEAFAIWNLLKSALSAAETPSASGKSVTAEQPQTSGESTVSQEKGGEGSAPPSANPPSTAPRANACEEYFLRHEQLKNHRKK